MVTTINFLPRLPITKIEHSLQKQRSEEMPATIGRKTYMSGSVASFLNAPGISESATATTTTTMTTLQQHLLRLLRPCKCLSTPPFQLFNFYNRHLQHLHQDPAMP